MTTAVGPLSRRIARARGIDVPEPTPERPAPRPVDTRPEWLKRATAKDLSGALR